MNSAAIVETLEKQVQIYQALLETSNQKKPILISNDVEQLNALTKKERQQMQQAEALEQLRIQQANQYFLSFGIIRTRAGSITDIIRIVTNAQDKKRLLELQQQLSDLLDELRRTNELNQQLITQSLRFIEYSLDLMVEDPTEDITYQHPKNPGYGNSRNGLFDTRG
ncbi:flagellar protein FlgN [Paenibacillus spongiae]|uniref:Flagellar protein FlgN n=1 Tax=Paenibacillus spongiae TaxID=2909671 RepID=A0ABY5SB22_9BACL|nr:flagellar protein FlgN [Paenibacillus spongiae]UVI29898.1 flagellar protein FlgN [Paenibacillus spongiae]